MGKVVGRVFIVFVLVILLVIGGAFALYNCSSNTPFESIRTNALNTAIDAMDIKERIDSELRARGQAIAEKYNLPSQLVDGGVDMLAIDQWEVVNTPTDAEVRDTVDIHLEGSDLKVTTYEDPNVISVESSGSINTFGQSITFSVPDSAQGITDVLSLYNKADESGVLNVIGALSQAYTS